MKKIIAMLLAVCMTFCACALADEDAVDLSLIDVKERGMLRVGMDKDYAPFCLIDETNEYTGFDVDFAYAICDVCCSCRDVCVLHPHRADHGDRAGISAVHAVP